MSVGTPVGAHLAAEQRHKPPQADAAADGGQLADITLRAWHAPSASEQSSAAASVQPDRSVVAPSSRKFREIIRGAQHTARVPCKCVPVRRTLRAGARVCSPAQLLGARFLRVVMLEVRALVAQLPRVGPVVQAVRSALHERAERVARQLHAALLALAVALRRQEHADLFRLEAKEVGLAVLDELRLRGCGRARVGTRANA